MKTSLFNLVLTSLLGSSVIACNLPAKECYRGNTSGVPVENMDIAPRCWFKESATRWSCFDPINDSCDGTRNEPGFDRLTCRYTNSEELVQKPAVDIKEPPKPANPTQSEYCKPIHKAEKKPIQVTDAKFTPEKYPTDNFHRSINSPGEPERNMEIAPRPSTCAPADNCYRGNMINSPASKPEDFPRCWENMGSHYACYEPLDGKCFIFNRELIDINKC